MINWRERMLMWENRKLRGHVKACLELIDDLSNLEAPLFEAKLPLSFKKKYVRIVTRAKRSIAPKK